MEPGTRRARIIAAAAARAALAVIAAGTALQAAADAPPPLPKVGAVVDMGLVKQNRYVQCRDGAYSRQVGNHSIWTFGDTCLTNGGVAGSQFIYDSAAGSSSLDATNGITLDLDVKDADGVPTVFIPYTAAEIAVNANHAPNDIALWAQDIVDDPARDRVLVFYESVYRGSDIGFNQVGAGIAVGDPTLQHVTRPVESTDPNAREPSYMWGAKEQNYTGGSLVVGDMLYSYGAHGVGLTTKMKVARVPLANALDKTQWRYWNGSAWTTSNLERDLATVFVGGAAGNTVYWNDYLGEYMAVYQHYADSTVWYRVANQPEGPWSDEAVMFVAAQGTDASYSAHVHPEYQADGGQTQYVTYIEDMGFLSQQMPLVKVTFQKP